MLTYKRIRAGEKLLSPHNQRKFGDIPSFLDECLDGPATASVTRYEFSGDAHILSFDIDKSVSWNGNPFGNIKNIQLHNKMDDAALNKLGLDVSQVPRPEAFGTIIPLPARDYIFLNYLKTQMSEAHRLQFQKDIEMDMGTNAKRCQEPDMEQASNLTHSQ